MWVGVGYSCGGSTSTRTVFFFLDTSAIFRILGSLPGGLREFVGDYDIRTPGSDVGPNCRHHIAGRFGWVSFRKV